MDKYYDGRIKREIVINKLGDLSDLIFAPAPGLPFVHDYTVCEALIDQDRYIGLDPVGYRCTNNTNNIVIIQGIIHYLCSACCEVWREQPDRVTFVN